MIAVTGATGYVGRLLCAALEGRGRTVRRLTRRPDAARGDAGFALDAPVPAGALAGVDTLIHYPVPPHLSEAYKERGWRHGDFPITEELARSVLSLPIGPHLEGGAADQVIAALRSFAGASGPSAQANIC